MLGKVKKRDSSIRASSQSQSDRHLQACRRTLPLAGEWICGTPAVRERPYAAMARTQTRFVKQQGALRKREQHSPFVDRKCFRVELAQSAVFHLFSERRRLPP